jgi:hypothetical protein
LRLLLGLLLTRFLLRFRLTGFGGNAFLACTALILAPVVTGGLPGRFGSPLKLLAKLAAATTWAVRQRSFGFCRFRWFRSFSTTCGRRGSPTRLGSRFCTGFVLGGVAGQSTE